MTTTVLETRRSEKLKTGLKPEDLKVLKELEKCSQSCQYFLTKYALIQDKATKKIVKWQPWDYLVNLLGDIQNNNELLIAKDRQIGISWFFCLYATWLATFFSNVRVLFLSQGQDEARDLIAKCKFIYNNITGIPLPKCGSDNRDMLDFPVNSSEIKALPSTEKAGRSTDATLVIRDEVEFHEYAEENFSAVGPTVDRGGKLIEMSTLHPYKTDTHFQKRFKDARAGISNAKAIWLSWRLRPLDDDLTTKYGDHDGFRKEVLEKKYNRWQLAKEYAESEEEAFSPTRTGSYFDLSSIDDLERDTYLQPIEHDLSKRNPGFVRIYKPPMQGRRYVLFCDPSDGKEDPHALIVMDWRTQEEVACSTGKCPVEWVANIYNDLYKAYNNAFNSFGLTGFAGGAFVKCLESHNVINQYRQKKDRIGCWESSNEWKANLILLEAAVRNKQIVVHSKEMIQQMRAFLHPEGGEPEIMRGVHDDFITAWRGVLLLAREMPVGTAKVFSFKYRET